MIRILTDFQSIDPDGSLYILVIGDRNLDQQQAQQYRLKIGDTVLLDADEGVVVTGTLDFKFVKMLGRESWVAHPNWSTRKDEAEA
ncbi:MAG TPA: hypothetical protein VMI56_13760 [Reyranella sp.]|nr:hypothetical protein [Reyranella sp.]